MAQGPRPDDPGIQVLMPVSGVDGKLPGSPPIVVGEGIHEGPDDSDRLLSLVDATEGVPPGLTTAAGRRDGSVVWVMAL